LSRKNDLRTFKTLNAIDISFEDLISSKAFRDITINDIASGAVINRSTFYLHYTDKYKLLDTLADQKLEKVINTISPESHIQNGKLNCSLFTIDLTNSLKVVAEHPKLYKFILNDSESLGLRKKAELALGEKLAQSFPVETTIARDLLIEIVSSIYVSVISWWLNNGMKYSAQFMAAQLVKFFELGSKSLLV
jgi:Transcriptional regulator